MQLAYLHRKPQKKITGVLPASLTKNRRKGSQRKMASHPYSYRVKLNIDNYLHLYTTNYLQHGKSFQNTNSHAATCTVRWEQEVGGGVPVEKGPHL